MFWFRTRMPNSRPNSIADDRLHDQRLGEPQRERAERRRRAPCRCRRARPVDPLPIRRRRRRRCRSRGRRSRRGRLRCRSGRALRQLVLRRVDRDVAVPLAIEERDVLGLGAATARRSACRSARVRISARKSPLAGQQRPRVAAQIAEVDRRTTSATPRGRPPARAAARAGRPARGCSADCVEAATSKSAGLIRTYAASKRVSSVSLPQKILTCPFSVAGAGWKLSVPRPSSTTRGDAAVDLGDEHRSLGQRQVEILGRDLQVARRRTASSALSDSR